MHKHLTWNLCFQLQLVASLAGHQMATLDEALPTLNAPDSSGAAKVMHEVPKQNLNHRGGFMQGYMVTR